MVVVVAKGECCLGSVCSPHGDAIVFASHSQLV